MTEKRTIGKLIEKEVRKQQLSIVEFADRICCKRNNVYNLKSASNLNGNLNCSKELEHYAS